MIVSTPAKKGSVWRPSNGYSYFYASIVPVYGQNPTCNRTYGRLHVGFCAERFRKDITFHYQLHRKNRFRLQTNASGSFGCLRKSRQFFDVFLFLVAPAVDIGSDVIVRILHTTGYTEFYLSHGNSKRRNRLQPHSGMEHSEHLPHSHVD